MKLKNFLNNGDYFVVTKNFGMIKESEEMFADEAYELINNNKEDVIQIKEDEDKLIVYMYNYNNYYTIQRMIF